jgi:phage terminase small subunit
MPGPLDNARHERFAQGLAEGRTADEAYQLAGFEANRGNACRLKANEHVQARVDEILEAAGERVEITKARVLAELGKIGFSDIRRAVKWYSQANVASIDDDPDTEALTEEGAIRFAVQNQVELISSDEIDDDTAAAISEVSMTDKGGLKVKFHDKRAALVDIGKHFGMFTEKVEHTGKDGGPIEIADTDLARLIVFQLTKASREG